jgi:hypothetical protein
LGGRLTNLSLKVEGQKKMKVEREEGREREEREEGAYTQCARLKQHVLECDTRGMYISKLRSGGTQEKHGGKKEGRAAERDVNRVEEYDLARGP